jgi:hypothetical protein
MGNGKLGSLIVLVIGFVIGLKWPQIRKHIAPVFEKSKKGAGKLVKGRA